ncbi:LacI family DNA-binding transcriptional regulator [Clostridium sp. DSM 17811]|nr:LacI family DNA-binding transcriptional regulator [Clostridium sp. DSM 17811]
MSAKTKENIHKALKELNYHRNDLTISLFYNLTYIIGLIFPTTSNPFFL